MFNLKTSSTAFIFLTTLLLASIHESHAARANPLLHLTKTRRRHLNAAPKATTATNTSPPQWAAIYAGETFTCGITFGVGHPLCWGTNFYFLNNASLSSSTQPVPISPNPSTDVKDIAIGGNFLCALYKNNDSAFCAGGGWDGATNFAGGVNLPGTWKSLAASDKTLCGIRLDDSLWCRGNNEYGQLGAGLDSERSSEFVQVSPGTTWKDVATGSAHTCGIQAKDDSLWCWGSSSYGQTGIDYTKYNGGDSSPTAGLNFQTNVPLPVNVSDSSVGWSSVSVSAGSATAKSTCGVQLNGNALCWGYNGDGSGGQNNTDIYLMYPKPVVTSADGPLPGKWTAISLGNGHTCGINDQKTYCWGSDTWGSVGRGITGGSSLNNVLAPVQVAGGGVYSSVSAGDFYTCGIQSPTNAGLCWGYNTYSVLGSGSNADSNKPQPLNVSASSILIGSPSIAPTPSPSSSTTSSPPLSTNGNAPPPLQSPASGGTPSSPSPGLNNGLYIFDSDPFAKTTPTTNNNSPPSSSSSSTPIGAIIGGVVGGVVVIAALLIGFMYWRKKKKNNTANTTNQATKRNSTLGGAAGGGDNINPSAPPLKNGSDAPSSKGSVAVVGAGANTTTTTTTTTTNSFKTDVSASNPSVVIDSVTDHHLDQNFTGGGENIPSPFVVVNNNNNSAAMNTPLGGNSVAADPSSATGNHHPLDRSNSSSFFKKMLDKLRSDKHDPTAAGVGAGVAVGAAAVGAGVAYHNTTNSSSHYDQEDDDALEDLPPKSSALASDPLLKFIRSLSGGERGGEAASLTTNAAASIASGGSAATSISTTSTALAVGGHVGAAGRRPSSGLVDVRPWMFNFDELDLIKVLGEGSFGKVYLARWRETAVAAKVLLDVPDTSSDQQAAVSISSPVLGKLQEEAALMATLRHPHVCNFMGICASPPCIASEYCKKGSLFTVLREAKASPVLARELTWQLRLRMALGAAKGMLYLHTHNPPIIHRDLKSPNLLVGAHWEIKVGDFNLSRLLEENVNNAHSTTTSAFNPRWLANELIEGGKVTTKSDVFSFGVVMWEMLTWRLPWPNENVWAIAKAVSEGQRLQVPPYDQLPSLPLTADGKTINVKAVEEYIKLMQRCWDQTPAKRPDFQEIIVKLRDILGLTSASGETQLTRTML